MTMQRSVRFLPDAPLQNFNRSLDRRILQQSFESQSGRFDERCEVRRFHQDRVAGLRKPAIHPSVAFTCRTRPRVHFRSGP
jgi:hypothetical protein